MLSAQCDELRAMAESVGLEIPQAATLMMRAADTICELRCKLSGTVDERERMFRANVEKNCDLMRLMDENAKMRKLLADAWGYINHPANATWTHKKRKEVRDSIGDRMRELGIEVD